MDIPKATASQRELVDEVKRFAGNGSLIPAEMSYQYQLNRFKTLSVMAATHRMHGLRRQYETFTGWKSPVAGGPTSKQLSADQKVTDRQARMTISRGPGHERDKSLRLI